MKNVLLKIKYMLIAAAIVTPVFTGCSKDVASLYDPNVDGGTPVVVDSVAPMIGINGVSKITIYGKNFATNAADNVAYFNSGVGTTISASATQIVVQAGIVTTDTAVIRVRKVGTLAFSNSKTIAVKAAAEVAYPFKSFEEPSAMEFDASGNLYVSVLTNAITNNIKKITPAGVVTNFTPDLGGGVRYTSLKMGPGGQLYGVRNLLRAVFVIPAAGGAPTTYAALPSGIQLKDIDFGTNGNLYCGGNNANLYRIKSDKTPVAYPFAYDVRALRVYNNALYVSVADTTGGLKGYIYKLAIDANGDLGTPELVTDLNAKIGANVICNAIGFAADGTMFLGTNATVPYYTVNGSIVKTFYSDLLATKHAALFMSWDNSSNFYYVRDQLLSSDSKVIDAYALYKVRTEYQGAIYNGR